MTPTFSVNGNNSASNTIATFYTREAINSRRRSRIPPDLDHQRRLRASVANAERHRHQPAGDHDDQQHPAIGGHRIRPIRDAMAANSTITWSASSGSFSGGGLYHSSSSSGTPTISASSGGISGSTVISMWSSRPAILASPSTVPERTTLTVVGAGGGLLSLLPVGRDQQAVRRERRKSRTSVHPAPPRSSRLSGGNIRFPVRKRLACAGLLGSTSETISVTVAQTLTSISVTPTSVS